ncbi:hypothetical protein BT93_E0053 [Corymbia citriodora subsp. variegata]|nr:hypothetical protein BT93_E0053 [Corymbia citriodora subsp. variegata]
MNPMKQTEFAGAREFDICSPMPEPSFPPPFRTLETETRSSWRVEVLSPSSRDIRNMPGETFSPSLREKIVEKEKITLLLLLQMEFFPL